MPVWKGKLKAEDEQRMIKNHTLMLSELDGKYIVDELFEKGIFTANDMEEVKCHNTARKRTEAMLNLLSHAGPGDAFKVFLTIVRKDYPQVAEALERTVIQKTDDHVSLAWIDNELSDAVKNHIIVDADASRYASCFGENWKLIMLRLGLPSQVIEMEIASNPSGNIPLTITALLIKWKQREYKNATVKNLLEVLKEAEEETPGSIRWDAIRNVTCNKIRV